MRAGWYIYWLHALLSDLFCSKTHSDLTLAPCSNSVDLVRDLVQHAAAAIYLYSAKLCAAESHAVSGAEVLVFLIFLLTGSATHTGIQPTRM